MSAIYEHSSEYDWIVMDNNGGQLQLKKTTKQKWAKGKGGI